MNSLNNNTIMSSSKICSEELNNINNNATKITCPSLCDSSSTSSKITFVNNNNNTLNRPWSSLFAKVKRGQSTFSSFSPRNNIKLKNDNALILDIHNLNGSLNEIMISLYDSVRCDIIAAKLHINKGIRSHLELIFISKEK